MPQLVAPVLQQPAAPILQPPQPVTSILQQQKKLKFILNQYPSMLDITTVVTTTDQPHGFVIRQPVDQRSDEPYNGYNRYCNNYNEYYSNYNEYCLQKLILNIDLAYDRENKCESQNWQLHMSGAFQNFHQNIQNNPDGIFTSNIPKSIISKILEPYIRQNSDGTLTFNMSKHLISEFLSVQRRMCGFNAPSEHLMLYIIDPDKGDLFPPNMSEYFISEILRLYILNSSEEELLPYLSGEVISELKRIYVSIWSKNFISELLRLYQLGCVPTLFPCLLPHPSDFPTLFPQQATSESMELTEELMPEKWSQELTLEEWKQLAKLHDFNSAVTEQERFETIRRIFLQICLKPGIISLSDAQLSNILTLNNPTLVEIWRGKVDCFLVPLTPAGQTPLTPIYNNPQPDLSNDQQEEHDWLRELTDEECNQLIELQTLDPLNVTQEFRLNQIKHVFIKICSKPTIISLSDEQLSKILNLYDPALLGTWRWNVFMPSRRHSAHPH